MMRPESEPMATFVQFRVAYRFLLVALLGDPAACLAAEPLTFMLQGVERTVVLHQPAGEPSGPRPLIIALHGLNQSVDSLRGWMRLEPAADREGFVVAYPSAVELSWSYGRPINKPMPMVSGETVDDVDFIRRLIEDLVSRRIADPARVYVTGASRGGLMAYTLACTLADRIAAVAPLITGMTEYQRVDCRPSRPVPIMVIAGTADRMQAFDGAQGSQGRLLSVPDTMDFWRQQHGCTGRAGQLLPHRNADDATRVLLVEWSSCRTGASPRLYRIEGGGHQIPSIIAGASQNPRNRDIETADEIWAFFGRFRL
jgi:polyhydroxybutyrate depolymerase